VAGTATYNDTNRTATFTPSSALALGQSYTATVNAKDTTGAQMLSPATWSFTTTSYTNITTMFPTNAVPGNPSAADPSAVSLGVSFKPTVSGQIVGVRFYQGTGNTGTQTGSLFSSSGTRLATVTFPPGTTGWNSAFFSTPVNVTAGTTYVASYFAPNGGYAADGGFFNNAYTNADGTLTAPAGTNGLYVYGSDSFPTNTYNTTNYWVDPLFIPSSSPPSPSPSPSPSQPTPPSVPAGAVTVFASTDTPGTANWNDNSAINVGMAFTSDVAGSVWGVRFYKGPSNTGTHSGSLWAADGTLLATGTFIESASGWQTLQFTSPVAITANTTYVASYSTSVGQYAANPGQLASGFDHAPLHIVATGGRYLYGAPAFPTNAVGHNYWVDVVFIAAS
jgi:hypothetical protein